MNLSFPTQSPMFKSSNGPIDICTFAYAINHNPRMIVINLLHILSALLGFVAFIFYFKTSTIQKALLIMSAELKLIIAVGLAYYLIGCLSAFVVYSYKIALVVFNVAPCSLVWTGESCFISMILYSNACVYAYSNFHFVLFIERLLVGVFRLPKQLMTVICAFMAVYLLTYPPYVAINTYKSRLGDYQDRPYCYTGANWGAPTNSGFSTALTLMLYDSSVSICDFLLLLYNKHQIANLFSKVSTYSLNRSFALRQSQISIRLIFPFSLVHSIGYIIQQSTYLISVHYSTSMTPEDEAFWREVINCVRTFVLFLMAASQFLYFQFKRKQTNEWIDQENATDKHFRVFLRMIA
ncbi:hypothetical protein M3Y96_00609100 [Aphelenchoides besseyi]|nr:hypothetical protein M3Y96_00609100 [Aphelenchoides besseyi]